MTLKLSIISISAAAFLVCSAGNLTAQTPAPEASPKTIQETDTRRGADFDLGLLGILGLLGLGGLAGRSRRDTVVTPRDPTGRTNR